MKRMLVLALVVSVAAWSQTPQYLPANGCSTTAGGTLRCNTFTAGTATTTTVSNPGVTFPDGSLQITKSSRNLSASYLGGSSLPPTAPYFGHAPTVRFSPLTVSNLSTSTGLSNGTTGVVATTEGTLGTGNIVLPYPIDVTKPWRAGAHVTIADTTANGIALYWYGPQGQSPVTYTITGSGGIGGNGLNQQWGNGNLPMGGYVFEWASDGNYVWACYFPDSLLTINGLSQYHGTYTGTPYCYEYAASAFGIGINTLQLLNYSTTDTVDAVFVQQGNLDPPPNPVHGWPMFLAPRIGFDSTAVQVPGSGNPLVPTTYIYVPGSYGSPSGTPIIWGHPTNEWLGFPGASDPTMAAFLNDGYAVAQVGANTGGIGGGYIGPDAIGAPWGGPTNNVYYNLAMGWVRNNLPFMYQNFQMGFSAGCISALETERLYPGNAAIQCVSGVNWIQDPYNSTLPTDAANGWGNFYIATQASTGQNPTTTSGYWTQLAAGPTPLPGGYLSPNYPYRKAWAAGTAYTMGQVVYMPYTGAANSLAAYDPHLSTMAPVYQHVPIRSSYCGLDVNYDVVTWPQMATNVAVYGGSVTNVVQTDGTCGDTTPDLFNSTAMVAFFDQYRTAAPPARFGAPPPASLLPSGFPDLQGRPNIAPMKVVMGANLATVYAQASASPIPYMQWPIAAGQAASISCDLLWEASGGPPLAGLTVALAGPTPAYGSYDAEIQTAAGSAAAPLTGQTSTTLPSVSGAVAGALNTFYSAKVNFAVVNGTTAGNLQVTVLQNTSGYGITIGRGSFCTFYPQ